MAGIKKRTFDILEAVNLDDLPTKIFFVFIMTLISLNVIAVMLETVESLSTKYSYFFYIFEVFSIAVFTAEYSLRLWSCTAEENFKHPLFGRIKFALTPLALIDLMAILPFYLPMFIPLDLRFIRAFRLFRVFRVLKVGRYSEAMRIIGNVIIKTKEELLTSMFVISILLIIASTLMYFVEHEAQPQVFRSVFDAIWWAVVTLTTVGYGDIYPITPLGKILGAITAILGVGMFALPAGILASGFLEEIQRRGKREIVCPYCGKIINEFDVYSKDE